MFFTKKTKGMVWRYR